MAKNYDIATIKKAIKDSRGMYSVIAKRLGCSWHTAKKYVEDDPETAQAYKNEEESMIDFAESKLHEAISEDDLTATIFFLKTKGRKRGYIEKTQNETEHTFKEIKGITFEK